MTANFTFFESYYQSVKDLPIEIKAEFYEVLFNYALYDVEPNNDTNPVVKAIFLMAKPNLDKSKARREAGKQGGSKPKQTKANLSKPKQTPSDKDKDKDIDKDTNTVLPINIISYYRDNISNLQSKIKESVSFKEIINKKQDMNKILTGLKNYSHEEVEDKYIKSLDKFIKDKVYLDYQEKKKEPVMDGLLYKGSVY